MAEETIEVRYKKILYTLDMRTLFLPTLRGYRNAANNNHFLQREAA